MRVDRNLSYVPGGHERQHLDLYRPDHWSRTDNSILADNSEGSRNKPSPCPLVIWIHGGAWMVGSREDCQTALHLIAHEYAVASIGYRLSREACFPAQLEDCQHAVRWLISQADHFGLMSDRVAVWGESAGGHLAALLGTVGLEWPDEPVSTGLKPRSRISAVIDWFGPTDFSQLGPRHLKENSPESRLIGGPVLAHPERVQQANPIHWITDQLPPFLIQHGQRDETIPASQSELLAQALRAAGGDVCLELLPEAGHGGPQFHGPDNQKCLETVVTFLDRHLREKANP